MSNRFVKPVVVVSKCLASGRCRWDGSKLSDPFVRRLKTHVKLVPVCPEVAIGLGVPRERIIVVEKGSSRTLYQPATGRRLTQAMNRYAGQFLQGLAEIDGFILKSRSPSCGISDVKQFDSFDDRAKITGRGSGLFGVQVLRLFGHLAVEDERRLETSRIREHWLTKLFTLAAFRNIVGSKSLQPIPAFHRHNQLLLQSYSRKQTAELHKLIAQQDRLSLTALVERYEQQLHAALKKPPRRRSMVAAMEEALLHYSSWLDSSERAEFRRSLEGYRLGNEALSDVRRMIQVWGVRYDKSFIRAHSIFRPYPGELG